MNEFIPHYFQAVYLSIGHYWYQTPYTTYGYVFDSTVYKNYMATSYRKNRFMHEGSKHDYESQLTIFGQFRRIHVMDNDD